MSYDAPTPGSPNEPTRPHPPQAPFAPPRPPQAPAPVQHQAFGPPPQQLPPTLQTAAAAAPQFMQPSGAPVTTVAEIKRTGGMRAALVAAVVAVGGGGAFATVNALRAPSGPASAEEAVDGFFAAVENEDVLGMLEMVSPAEREAYVEPSLETFGHLQRLGILAEQDLSAVGVYDLEIEGLTYTATPVNAELTWVTLTGGTVTASSTGQNPLGPTVTDRVAELNDVPITTEVDTIQASDDVSFAVVNQDGGWFLSMTYTMAESARRDAGLGLPDFDAAPAPTGAATPEAAVSEFVAEAVDTDLTGMLTHLDPQEFAALYDYAPLVLDRAQREIDAAAADLKAEGYTWSAEVASTRVEERNGRTVVIVDGVNAELTGPDLEYSISYTDGCSTIEMVTDWSSDSVESCIDDPVGGDMDLWLGDGFGAEVQDLAVFRALADYEGGVTVVERDGAWYLAGGPTFIGLGNDLLALLEPGDIEEAIDFFETKADEWAEPSEWYFEEVDEAISLDDDSTAEPREDFSDLSTSTTMGPVEDGIDEPVSTTMPAVADLGVELPADYDVWAQTPDTWWLGWLYDLPEPEAVATVWGGDDYVDLAVMADGDGIAVYEALLANDTFPVGSTELAGLDPSAVVLANDTQIVVIVGTHVLSGFPGESEALLVEVGNLLVQQG